MLSSLLSGTKEKGTWAGVDKSQVHTVGALHLSEHLDAPAWDTCCAWVLNPQGTAWDSLPKSGSLLPALPVAYGSSGIPLFSQVCKSLLPL